VTVFAIERMETYLSFKHGIKDTVHLLLKIDNNICWIMTMQTEKQTEGQKDRHAYNVIIKYKYNNMCFK